MVLPSFLPGQYISLQLFIPKLGVYQPRQYSLSDAPPSQQSGSSENYYRISVKKESGKDVSMPGLISNMLHADFKEGDIVELTHPTGEFFVRVEEETPLVLISAGVGITPMISILNSILSKTPSSSRRVSLIHGAHASEVRAFSNTLKRVAQQPNVQTTLFLTTPKPEDAEGVDYDFAGRVDLEKVGAERLLLGDGAANYYVCGPNSFMADVQKGLLDRGVSQDRVHLEIFGVGN